MSARSPWGRSITLVIVCAAACSSPEQIVVPPPPPPNIAVTVTPTQVAAFAGFGDEFTLEALVTDTLRAPLSNQDVIWSVSPASAAITITPEGALTVAGSAAAGTYSVRAAQATVHGEATVHVLPRPTGVLVFSASVGGNGQVFLKDLSNDAPPAQVTNDLGSISGIVLDPTDGTIVFSRGALPSADLFRINRNGTGLINLTGDAISQNQGPAIHPVTREIYFTRRVAGDLQVVRMPPAGGTVTPVTTGSQSKSQPALSPDGAWFAWSETFPGFNTEIMVARTDGTDLQRITDRAGGDISPTWGSATRLFWSGLMPETSFDILMVDMPGGTNLQNVTPYPGGQASPTGGCLPNKVMYVEGAPTGASIYEHDVVLGLRARYRPPGFTNVSFLRRECP